MRLTYAHSLDDIKAKAKRGQRLVYGAVTCWWRILERGEAIGYEKPGPDLGPNPAITRRDGSPLGLPCDPRGGVLMMLERDSVPPFAGATPVRLASFIESAEQNPRHYGRWGLDAFVLAYHGNLVDQLGRPTCMRTWAAYNAVLDGETDPFVIDQVDRDAHRLQRGPQADRPAIQITRGETP